MASIPFSQNGIKSLAFGRGIKGKFVSLAFALLLFVTVFIIIFFPLRQAQQMSKDLKDKVYVVSDMVAQSTTSGVIFDDIAGVNNYLQFLKSLEEVRFVYVYKRSLEGQTFSEYAHYNPDNGKPYLNDIQGLMQDAQNRNALELEDVTIAIVPSTSDNDIVGKVVVGITRETLKHDVRQSRIVATLVGIAVLAFGSMVFFWLSDRIVQPLQRLESASRKVAEGDMNVEVNTDSKDEVGVLANAFNVMVANIRSSIEEIRNKNTALVMQQEIIEQFNKRITDSVQYSKRIQGAILPDPVVMSKALREYGAEHFIIFKPKDVVSGDFYWFSKVDDKVLVAVIDCTGHGVPGAFMSMIGNTLLNEIVNQKRITDPAQILADLHEGVRVALKQDSDNMLAQDGMEVCLCVLEGKTITFAGANRPLFLIREGGTPERIKGSRQPIGGKNKAEDNAFENHRIEIKSGLSVYLTSDGYIDQKGDDGTKMSTAGLQRLIQKTHILSTAEQRAQFVQTLYDHQGNEDQRDDISLVGLQFRQ